MTETFSGNRIRLMTFASPLIYLSERWERLAALIALLASALMLWVVLTRPSWEVPASAGAPDPLALEPALERIGYESVRAHMSIFRGEGPAEGGGVFSEAFRFAGTFFRYDASGGEVVVRRAVLAHRPSRQQFIVSEGDVVEGVTVGAIRAQELILAKDGQEVLLRLDGVASGAVPGRAGAEAGVRGAGVGLGAGGPNRFGLQHEEDGIWRMDRQALMGYYEELLDEPERLLQVFDSMQPLYTETGTIEGYRVEPVGEQAFFEAVGFREGDTVRSVNALPMTNRRRAEFFIRQVVEKDMSAIVIDLERDGEPVRVVYEIR